MTRIEVIPDVRSQSRQKNETDAVGPRAVEASDDWTRLKGERPRRGRPRTNRGGLLSSVSRSSAPTAAAFALPNLNNDGPLAPPGQVNHKRTATGGSVSTPGCPREHKNSRHKPRRAEAAQHDRTYENASPLGSCVCPSLISLRARNYINTLHSYYYRF